MIIELFAQDGALFVLEREPDGARLELLLTDGEPASYCSACDCRNPDGVDRCICCGAEILDPEDIEP